jgi:hypothetical protein
MHYYSNGIFDPIITRTPLGIILLFDGNMFLITLKENGYRQILNLRTLKGFF